MAKLISTWEELSQVPANDKYKIIVDFDRCSGWVVPVCDEFDKYDDFICHCPDVKMSDIHEFYKHHMYLSTHTFYGSRYKEYTKILQGFGFDIELDNWDKERNDK